MPIDATELAAGLAGDPTFKQIQAAVGDMGKLVRGLVSIQQQQTSVLNEIRTKVNTDPNAHKAKNGDDDTDDDSDDDVDVNSLDNSGFQKFLMKEIGGLLDEKLGAVSKNIEGVSNAFHSDKIRKEYGELKEDNPDFDDWQDEMRALAKDFPALGLKRLYTLARSENDVKAKELDAKYAKQKNGDGTKDDKTLTLFGGFRPTIGKTGGGDSGKKEEKLTPAEAGEKAWEETVARFPGLSSLETNPLD